MDMNSDYSSTFKAISGQLKKRFLRKPNVANAIDEYTALSRQLESEECSSLAGYCMQQVARCQRGVGNPLAESAALQLAAKHYLNAEIAATVETATLTFNENLTSCMSLYDEAIRLHELQHERLLAAKLCLEMADILHERFERHYEAMPYYERAAALFATSTQALPHQYAHAALFVQFKLAAIKVFTADMSGALNIYTDICHAISNRSIQTLKQQQQTQQSLSVGDVSANKAPIGVYATLLVEADISKLLLLVYLKPTKMRAEHSTTIEVYTWFQSLSSMPSSSAGASAQSTAGHGQVHGYGGGSGSGGGGATGAYMPVLCMDRDLFILLQSFVMACQSLDLRLLRTLQSDLQPALNDVQNHLVSLIVDQLLDSSYTDDLLFQ